MEEINITVSSVELNMLGSLPKREIEKSPGNRKKVSQKGLKKENNRVCKEIKGRVTFSFFKLIRGYPTCTRVGLLFPIV